MSSTNTTQHVTDNRTAYQDAWAVHDNNIYCSVCGANALFENTSRDESAAEYKQVKSRFCPNCGSPMVSPDETMRQAAILNMAKFYPSYLAWTKDAISDALTENNTTASDENIQAFIDFTANRIEDVTAMIIEQSKKDGFMQ